MKQYNGLLTQIALELDIKTHSLESELDYKSRIIYSALGAIGYASLLDCQEDTDANSIVHFKRRIRDALWSYIDLYPALRSVFTCDWESICNELYDIFIATGQVYHTPNWLSLAAPCCSQNNDLTFIRGASPDYFCSFSGIGRYTKHSTSTFPAVSVNEMFALPSQSLSEQWTAVLRNCKWAKLRDEAIVEYHRLTPPFHRGYWTNIPQKKNSITLARTGLPGSRIYYLCQIDNGQQVFSQLPSWLTDDYGYRTISTCCLHTAGTLPPINYQINGELVTLHFSYLLPPPELNFMRLYSWPTSYAEFPHNFHRTMDLSVFTAFQSILEAIGYQFAKE